jgi:hypothetical protein
MNHHDLKMLIEGHFVRAEPAEVNHRWAEYNERNIGTKITFPHVCLFDSDTGRLLSSAIPRRSPACLTTAPSALILHCPRDRQNFSVTIYLRIARITKSFNSIIHSHISRRLDGFEYQIAAAFRMLYILGGKNKLSLGGWI